MPDQDLPKRRQGRWAAMIFIVWLSVCFPSAAAEAPAKSDTTVSDADKFEFFEKQVRPTLQANCFKCHGPDEQKGGLRLDAIDSILAGGDTGPAIVAGKPDESELITAIRYGEDGYQMPPTGKLDDESIEILTRWV